MSLANKYRPMTFDDVVEQQHITDILKAHSSKGSSHSNYLFFGPRGTGKTTCARILAKALNCENIQNGNPCNECASCSMITSGKAIDIIEIDAASHTGVDNIRSEIIDKAGYAPAQLKMKIYIIDEVHMLSKGAFNALLKIMEEPGDKIRFILATTEINKVIDTIVSRCQVFNFKRINNKALVKRLQDIAAQENLSVSDDALDIIAEMSEGCMRDAIKYLDQVSILGDITESNVTQFLGVAATSTIENFIQTLIDAKKTQSYEDAFTKVLTMNENGVDLLNFTKQVLAYINQHLTRDIDAMSELAGVFSDIMMQNKRYPQPILLYKTKIYNYIMGAKAGTANPPATVSKTAAEKIVEKVVEKTSEKPQVEDKKTEVAEAKKPHEGTSDLVQLTKSFIDSIDKPSLKSMFDDQCKIVRIEHNIVEIVVINPMAKLQVNKKDTLEYLESVISKLLDKNHSIIFTFKSKEEFMESELA